MRTPKHPIELWDQYFRIAADKVLGPSGIHQIVDQTDEEIRGGMQAPRLAGLLADAMLAEREKRMTAYAEQERARLQRRREIFTKRESRENLTTVECPNDASALGKAHEWGGYRYGVQTCSNCGQQRVAPKGSV